MDTIASAIPVSADPLADISAHYTAQIRAEIERDVRELVNRLKGRYGIEYMPTLPIHPDYILLGHLINTHRGRSLYQEGDRIEEVPVKICRDAPRTITVCADNVEFEYEDEVKDEDEGGDVWRTKTRYTTENLRESSTW